MTENKDRVVITGLGMISAIGHNVEECINAAKEGKSGIAEAKSVCTDNCYSKLGAEVKDFNMDIPGTEGMDRVSKLAITASMEACKDAGLDDFNNSERVSVIMGSCVGGAVSIEGYYKNGKTKEDVLRMPIGTIANDVALIHHAGGVVTNVANACAAGTISIAYACDLIRAGKADIVLAGGSDSFASVPYAGFLALHALDPDGCSPFNHLSGITLGEGAGVVVVESYEHAKKRNAHMYCEVLGQGVTSDAHHITAPRDDAMMQVEAMERALKTSGVKKEDIGYINAHGTGTHKNDESEFLGAHKVFDGANDNLSISSTKAMVGHCLGAAGAVEAVFTIRCLTDQVVLPTLGFSEADLETLKERAGAIDFVPNKAHKKELHTVMSNNYAFGGNDASIVFADHQGDVKVNEYNDKVAVTGFGVLTPLSNNVEEYKANIDTFVPENASIHTTYEDQLFDTVGLKRAFYRKLDNLSKMQAISGMQALMNAGIIVTEENDKNIGIVVGTSEGALSTCCQFQENICEKGNENGSAFNFPNTVYNAAGGYLSICSGIKGYNVTVTNGAQAGLQSVAYAVDVLRNGVNDTILTTGIDENTEVSTELFNKVGLIADNKTLPFEGNKKGFTLSDGAVSLILENESKALARGAKVYAHITGYGMAHQSVRYAEINGTDVALEKAINLALKDANLTIDDIDAVESFANGFADIDNIEVSVLSKVFGNKLDNLALFAIKENLGEARAAGAMAQVLDASLLLDGSLEHKNAYYISNGKAEKKSYNKKELKNILVTSYGAAGSYTAIIVSK